MCPTPVIDPSRDVAVVVAGVPWLTDELHSDEAAAEDGLRRARVRRAPVLGRGRRGERRVDGDGRPDWRLQPRRLVHDTQPESRDDGDDTVAGQRPPGRPTDGRAQAAVGPTVGDDHPARFHRVRHRHRLHRPTDHRLHESHRRRRRCHGQHGAVDAVPTAPTKLRRPIDRPLLGASPRQQDGNEARRRPRRRGPTVTAAVIFLADYFLRQR